VYRAEALDVLDGLMLGDGNLDKHVSGARFLINLSKPSVSLDDHLKYLRWIADNVFRALGVPVSKGYPRVLAKMYKGELYQYAQLSTLVSPLLETLHNVWYTGGEWTQEAGSGRRIRGATKVIPTQLIRALTLPLLALVHWFLGDGGSSLYNLDYPTPTVDMSLSTQGFSVVEVYHLMRMLNNAGIHTIKPHKDDISGGSGLKIRLSQGSIDYFMSLVEPHVLEIFGDSVGPSYKDMIKYKDPTKAKFNSLKEKIKSS